MYGSVDGGDFATLGNLEQRVLQSCYVRCAKARSEKILGLRAAYGMGRRQEVGFQLSVINTRDVGVCNFKIGFMTPCRLVARN
jgi:hypothetical protein